MTDLGFDSLLLHEYLTHHPNILVTAESCTGGLVAAAMTAHAGSSAYMDRGFVTYSNSAKMQMLGVPETTLEQFGAVSEEVAAAMALGAIKNSRAHVSLAITGIAGPGGASPGKPVGTVCFGWSLQSVPLTRRCHFEGDREAVRQQAACFAIRELLTLLENAD